jgi:putative FmdB family regulatory protein
LPIYEYTCKSCKKPFEKLVRTMSGGEKVTCPECGSNHTARALSVFAVGAEGTGKSRAKVKAAPGCGRCGGPGPCGMG